MINPKELLRIDYTNYKGERAWRLVRPIRIEFTSSRWHPATQWLMTAYDVEKKAGRVFALTSIHEIRGNE